MKFALATLMLTLASSAALAEQQLTAVAGSEWRPRILSDVTYHPIHSAGDSTARSNADRDTDGADYLAWRQLGEAEAEIVVESESGPQGLFQDPNFFQR